MFAKWNYPRRSARYTTMYTMYRIAAKDAIWFAMVAPAGNGVARTAKDADRTSHTPG
jgi:hypothetical protein